MTALRYVIAGVMMASSVIDLVLFFVGWHWFVELRGTALSAVFLRVMLVASAVVLMWLGLSLWRAT